MSREPNAMPWTRTLPWLIRREIWEHRAIWVAPAAVAGFAALVHVLSSLTVADARRAASLANSAHSNEFMMAYNAATGATVVAGMLVGLFYCLDALQGERRDRSILFWKSLPVSDALTVLSKALIPLVVIPLIAFAVAVAATTTMFGLQSLVWTLDGFDPRDLWTRLNLPFMWLSLLYGLPFMALWNAPLFAWVLLASAWSRRMAIVWAGAPLAAFLLVEHMLLHQTPADWLAERRIGGAVFQPYTMDGAGKVWIERLSDLDPARIYALPGLWIGVLLAAAFLTLAIRIRRSRTPN